MVLSRWSNIRKTQDKLRSTCLLFVSSALLEPSELDVRRADGVRLELRECHFNVKAFACIPLRASACRERQAKAKPRIKREPRFEGFVTNCLPLYRSSFLGPLLDSYGALHVAQVSGGKKRKGGVAKRSTKSSSFVFLHRAILCGYIPDIDRRRSREETKRVHVILTSCSN